MKSEPDSLPPKKEGVRTAQTLFLMVGGFLLLIMAIGWLIVALR